MKISNNILCPVCGETALQLIEDKETQTYKDCIGELDFHYAECSECGAETATPDQVRFNKRQMIKFQKQVDGLLSSEEVKAIREELGLTIKEAGEVFGGGPVAFSKYENDDLMQSLPMDSALILARENPLSVKKLASHRGIEIDIMSQINKQQGLINILTHQSSMFPLELHQTINHMQKFFNIPVEESQNSLNIIIH